MGMTPSLPSWGQWRSSLVLLRWRSGCSLLTPDPTILIYPELHGLCWGVLLVLACRRKIAGVKPEMQSCGWTFKQVFTSFQLYKHFSGSWVNTILSPPFPSHHLCCISVVATDLLRNSVCHSSGIFSWYGNAAIPSKFPGQMCSSPQQPWRYLGPTSSVTFQCDVHRRHQEF